MAAPVDAGRIATNITTAASPWTVSLPASIAAGNLLILFVRVANASTITTPAGWSVLVAADTSDATDDVTAVYYKKATGSEGATLSLTLGTSSKGSALAYRITGAKDPTVRAPVASSVTVFTTAANAADPPSLTPGGGTRDFLFLALAALDKTSASSFTAAPSGYTNLTNGNSGAAGTAASNCIIAGATKTATAASDNPAAFTHTAATTGGSVITIGVDSPVTVTSGSVNLSGLGGSTIAGRSKRYAAAALVGVGASIIAGIRVPPLGPGIDAYTVLCIHADGADGSTTFVDASSYAHPITTSGDVQVDTAESVFGGGSFYSPAPYSAANRLQIDSTPDLNLGSGDFTIETRAWFETTDIQYLVAKWNNWDPHSWNFIYNPYAGGLQFGYTPDNLSNIAVYSSSWVPTLGIWYHLVVVRYGSVVKFFINGTQQGADQTLTGAIADSDTQVYIGNEDYYYGQYPMRGRLDEIRISKGIARWVTNFTPPTSPYALPSINGAAALTGNGTLALTGPALLANFNQANNTSSLGAGWTGDLRPGGWPSHGINGNQLYPDSAYKSTYWNTPYGANQAAYLTVVVAPSEAADNAWMELWARVTNPNTGTLTGYFVRGNSDSLYLGKSVAGAETIIAGSFGDLANGDILKLEPVGNQIRTWRYRAGAWTLLDTTTDSSITGGGYIGVASGDTTMFRADDFGGGPAAGPYRTPAGAAALTGLGAATIAGRRIRLGAAALAGLGAATVAGRRIRLGAAALTGVGSSTAAGARRVTGAAALTGTSSATIVGRHIGRGAATLTGAGTTSAAALHTGRGAATLAGVGSATIVGRHTGVGAATLTGLGAATIIGRRIALGAAALTGQGALSADARRKRYAAAALVGAGALTASGTVPARNTVYGSAALTGTSAQTAAGTRTTIAVAALVGTGGAAALGRRTTYAAAALTGQGALTATGQSTGLGASAHLAGTSTLTATGRSTARGAATLVGQGALTATGRHTGVGIIPLAGAGALTATGRAKRYAAAALAGAGTSSVAGVRVRFGAAALAGQGALTATGMIPASAGTIFLTGHGTLTATGARVFAGAVPGRLDEQLIGQIARGHAGDLDDDDTAGQIVGADNGRVAV